MSTRVGDRIVWTTVLVYCFVNCEKIVRLVPQTVHVQQMHALTPVLPATEAALNMVRLAGRSLATAPDDQDTLAARSRGETTS
jgi:hypothetical protein